MERRRAKDAELVAKAQKGDLRAFDHLLARHRQRAFNIARQIAGDPEAAQDIVQEAFVQAFRSLHTLRGQDSFARFGPWLNTILRRQAQRWLHKRERAQEPMDSEMILCILGSVWKPESEPELSGELVERVRAALRALSERERKVMILHYLEGRSCEEIAENLRLSVGSIKRILYDSRQKARKEAEKMTRKEEGRKGPRRLIHWISGSFEPSRRNVFDFLRPRLAQTLCLAVNKSAKTPQQISEEIAAHTAYVEETAADLLRMKILLSPKKARYRANFIALDGADWRRLVDLLPCPAARAAQHFAKSAPRFQAAYEKTPLAGAGWAWVDMLWPIYGVIVANAGISRNCPCPMPLPRPERPDGGRYWLGGHEELPGSRCLWTTGFNCSGTGPVWHGYFWAPGLSRENEPPLGGDALAVHTVFAHGPLGEEKALAQLGGVREHWRGVLAEQVKLGFLGRSKGQFHLAIPVFAQGDSEALTPEVDAVVRPIIKDALEPLFTDVSHLLDEMGYSHHRDQYPLWHHVLRNNIMGEALRFLMEQGVLPRPSEPAPTTFAFIAWKGDLPLMSWGVE